MVLCGFAKRLILHADDAGKTATLELAMIDDNDITYVNGVKVGATNSYNAKRNYTIPAGILKEGKNVIAIRVEDTGGGGGVYGDSSDMKLLSEIQRAVIRKLVVSLLKLLPAVLLQLVLIVIPLCCLMQW